MPSAWTPLVAVSALCSCAGLHTPAATVQVPAHDVSRRITVAEDATVFTLFAMLNAAGYDLENREVMHPVRLAVRADLARRLSPELRSRLRGFYDSHATADPWSYSVVAKATSGPPDFTPTSAWKEISTDTRFGDLAPLHELLRTFYREADVPAMYAPVRPAYRDTIRDYEMAIHREVASLLAYCRVSIDALGGSTAGEKAHALVIPNLLDSYEHAFSFELDGRFISVEGPQPRIGYNPHEFAHAVTNPAVYSAVTRALDASLRPLVEEGGRALGSDGSFASPEAFVDENLVRAVALRYLSLSQPERTGTLESAMKREYLSGYILERFFWEQLAAYERSRKDLRAFYPQMLKALDPSAVLATWRQERSGSR